jgi:hypothetical protein
MPQLITNIYVSLMYELKNIGTVFTSKFFGTGTSSYKKSIYRAAVSQMLRNTDLDALKDMKISCIWQQSNHDSPILFTSSSLYRRYFYK